MKKEVICIGCPSGCKVSVTLTETGEIANVSGNRCREGLAYIKQEAVLPKRILNTTVIVEGDVVSFLPVKVDKPIPRDLYGKCMDYIANLRIKPPIKEGQIIVENLLGQGANLIATDSTD